MVKKSLRNRIHRTKLYKTKSRWLTRQPNRQEKSHLSQRNSSFQIGIVLIKKVHIRSWRGTVSTSRTHLAVKWHILCQNQPAQKLSGQRVNANICDPQQLLWRNKHSKNSHNNLSNRWTWMWIERHWARSSHLTSRQLQFKSLLIKTASWLCNPLINLRPSRARISFKARNVSYASKRK